MKNLIFLVVFGLVACQAEGPAKQTNSEQVVAADKGSCKYSFAQEKTSIKWTAFKTPQKVGVGGAFDSFEIKLANQSGSSIAELFKDASFTIDTKSVNTNDKGRDAKIVHHFFDDGMSMSGQVVEVTDSTIKLMLKINNVQKVTELKYTITDGVLDAKGSIDVLDFSMNSMLQALNKACYALHQGKTWSDVDINLIADLSETCK